MVCNKCGKENDTNSLYCYSCGEKLMTNHLTKANVIVLAFSILAIVLNCYCIFANCIEVNKLFRGGELMDYFAQNNPIMVYAVYFGGFIGLIILSFGTVFTKSDYNGLPLVGLLFFAYSACTFIAPIIAQVGNSIFTKAYILGLIMNVLGIIACFIWMICPQLSQVASIFLMIVAIYFCVAGNISFSKVSNPDMFSITFAIIKIFGEFFATLAFSLKGLVKDKRDVVRQLKIKAFYILEGIDGIVSIIGYLIYASTLK